MVGLGRKTKTFTYKRQAAEAATNQKGDF